MFTAPIINAWVDMIIIVIVFAGLNKLIQHITINPYKYFAHKKKSKDIQKEMNVLAKEQKMDEVKAKQKEAFKMVGEQWNMSMKSMLVMLVIAFPLLWFVNKYYQKIMYDFGLFTANGFWAYVILGVIISIIISTLYDKLLMEKYTSDTNKKIINEISK
jgi:uncharacterized membrane protein (DUF106 family)